MADSTRKTANKGHFLRGYKSDTLKIVTDQNVYLTTNIEENNNAILEKYNKFTEAQINIPLAVKSGLENNDNSKISQASSSTNTPENSNKGAQQTAQEFQASTQKKPGKKLPMIKVPDLFKNVKIKKRNYLKYKRVNLDKFAPPTTEGTIIPNHYVKYIDPTNAETQNTEEKNWTFDKKLYEITETTIENLKKFKIDISPSDCEWVIDCFEKTAINDKKQSKIFLIQEFRRRVPQDVQNRVSDEAMGQIYDHCWKTQREQRANRSFIRVFWWYQDKVGDDNFATFAQQAQRPRPCIRLKIQAQVNNYCNCFIERESSAYLCKELQAMNVKIYQEIDVWRLEDAQFDMLIGKEPQDPRFKFLNSKQPLSELAILQNQQMQIPLKSKPESLEVVDKLQSLTLQEQLIQNDRYLNFVVQETRTPPILEQNIHRSQSTPVDPYNRANNANIADYNPKKDSKPNKNKQQKDSLVNSQQKPGSRLRGNDASRNNEQPAPMEDITIPVAADQPGGLSSKLRNKTQQDKTPEESKQEQILNDKKADKKHDSLNQPIENIANKKRKNQIKKEELKVKQKIDNPIESQDQDKQPTTKEDALQDMNQQKIDKLATVDNIPINQQIKKVPKIKRKKYQSIGREMIRLFSMIMHKQKEIMGLKIHPEEIKKEKVDITNTQRINLLQSNNYQFNREQLDKLKNTHLSHVAEQRQERQIEMKKKFRTIEQETLICSYQSTDQYQFDFMPKKEQPLDEFEKLYQQQKQQKVDNQEQKSNNQNQLGDFRKQCLKQKKQIKKIQDGYEALKNRCFRVRRGRNNRILYKSQVKTIFGYDSIEPQDFTHDVMDDLLIKINERENQKKEKEKKTEMKFHKKIDKLLMDQKLLADDLEKYCYNKRLKKNIYKMDMMHNLHNGQKQGIETSVYTQASCDYERIPRVTNDPVINNLYKRIHAPAYQQLMNHQSDKQLLNSGVLQNNVYENQGTIEQKLQMYNDMYGVNNDQTGFQAGLKEQQDSSKTISNSDRQDLLRNIKFIKNEHAYLFEAYEKHKSRHKHEFNYGNLSMQDFKANLLRDFNSFKMHISNQQDSYMFRQEQPTGIAQTIE